MRTIERLQAFARLLGFTELLFDNVDEGNAFIDLAQHNPVLANVPMSIEWVDAEEGRKIEVTAEETVLSWANLSKYCVSKEGLVSVNPVNERCI